MKPYFTEFPCTFLQDNSHRICSQTHLYDFNVYIRIDLFLREACCEVEEVGVGCKTIAHQYALPSALGRLSCMTSLLYIFHVMVSSPELHNTTCRKLKSCQWKCKSALKELCFPRLWSEDCWN
jgi:hypothetical protein